MRELILSDKGRLCELFLKHIETCDSCKEKMMEKFGGNIMEKFQSNGVVAPNYFEIFMVILVGIFIIIIMDSFVRLGKIMGKR